MSNIILFGQMGSGKSTVAKYLCDNYGYTKFSLGEKIHSECELYGMHDREHLQNYGQMMRQVFNESIWCDYLISRSKGIDKIVIDDARQENEYNYFTKKRYLPIAIIADEELRLERLQKRVDYKIKPDSFKHETELQAMQCVNKCKIKLFNSYPLFTSSGLYDQINRIMEEINE